MGKLNGLVRDRQKPVEAWATIQASCCWTYHQTPSFLLRRINYRASSILTPTNEKNMLSFDAFIEIGQDGVGIIETGTNGAKGFFTASVESCLVTVYVFKKTTILIHDSSQLALSHITSLIKKYGTVRKLIVAYGKNVDSKHSARLQKIIDVTGVGKHQLKIENVPLNAFAFMCSTSGDYRAIHNAIPTDVARIPEQKKRLSVCEVNNFFLEPNAQSLRLDIQYHDGAYAPVRELDKPLDKLLKTINGQSNFFFQNVAVLNEAHNQGILLLPRDLRDLAEKYNLERLRFQIPSPQDRIDEAAEFEKYMKSSVQSN